jgi:hypothetical protein
MRRIVAMRSGWVFSTIRLIVASSWQRTQRSTCIEATMRSICASGMSAPGWLCMRSTVRRSSTGSKTAVPSRRAV